MAELSNASKKENGAAVVKGTRRRSSTQITNAPSQYGNEDSESSSSRKRSCRSTPAPQLPQASDQPRKKEKAKTIYASRPTYAMLRQKMCSKWMKNKYAKIPVKEQDKSIVDLEVDIQVATRSSEGHVHWDRQTRMMGNKNTFEIDYIVTLTPRKLGGPLSDRVLIKWTDYPRSTWEHTITVSPGTEALDMCETREDGMDFVELNLRTVHGDDLFDRIFPFRYLQYEAGRGEGGYVESKRAIYKNLLRSIEWRWNHVNRLSGQPMIYIEDWTTEPEDAESLKNFLFVNFLSNSVEVDEILKKNNNQLAHKKCDGGQCSTCMIQSQKGDEHSHCCGMTYTLDVDEDGKLKWDDEMAQRANFECIPECGCGDKCRNKVVTNGRQTVLCVFREIGKGWGLRTVQELPNCTFVTEYVGQMCAKRLPRSDPKWIYDIPMEFDVRDVNGYKIHSPLVISAGNMGNESRFINHSCEPNLRGDTFIIERHGIWYNHEGFFTTKKIDAGEELTFDYFPYDDGKTPRRRMFNECRCNSEMCRLNTPPSEMKRRLKTRQIKKMKMKMEKSLKKKLRMKGPLKKRTKMRKTLRRLLSTLVTRLSIRKRSKDTEVEKESKDKEAMKEKELEMDEEDEESQEEWEENKI